jgi:hypothetical protein
MFEVGGHVPASLCRRYRRYNMTPTDRKYGPASPRELNNDGPFALAEQYATFASFNQDAFARKENRSDAYPYLA